MFNLICVYLETILRRDYTCERTDNEIIFLNSKRFVCGYYIKNGIINFNSRKGLSCTIESIDDFNSTVYNVLFKHNYPPINLFINYNLLNIWK